jgi:hypothetical protein
VDNNGVSTGNIDAGGNVKITNKVVSYTQRRPLVVLGAASGATLITILFVINMLTGGTPASGVDKMVGQWKSADGVVKTFIADGSCQGFYYTDDGKLLDIGGPMTCAISKEPGSEGRYAFDVRQGPNRNTYGIEFNSENAATVYSSVGKKLYVMTRF